MTLRFESKLDPSLSLFCFRSLKMAEEEISDQEKVSKTTNADLVEAVDLVKGFLTVKANDPKVHLSSYSVIMGTFWVWKTPREWRDNTHLAKKPAGHTIYNNL